MIQWNSGREGHNNYRRDLVNRLVHLIYIVRLASRCAILYSNTVTRARMAPRAAPLRPRPIRRSHPTLTLHVVGRVLGGESLRGDRRDDFSKSIFWPEVILPPFS